MSTCATCVHWQHEPGSYRELPMIGRCMAVLEYWSATEWAEDGESRVLKPAFAAKLAFAQDGSDYHAALLTLPEFGCVMHEAKDL